MLLSSKRRGRPCRRGAAVRLRDGSGFVIRSVGSADKELLTALVEGSSDDSRYRRFHAPKLTLSEPELQYLTEIDHRDHEALIAIDRHGDAAAVARYVRLPDEAETAEAAILVRDEWQGRGLGTVLLARLADCARGRGIRRFRAIVQADNQRARQLFEELGSARVVAQGGGTRAIEVELGSGGSRPESGARGRWRSGGRDVGPRWGPLRSIFPPMACV